MAHAFTFNLNNWFNLCNFISNSCNFHWFTVQGDDLFVFLITDLTAEFSVGRVISRSLEEVGVWYTSQISATFL